MHIFHVNYPHSQISVRMIALIQPNVINILNIHITSYVKIINK